MRASYMAQLRPDSTSPYKCKLRIPIQKSHHWRTGTRKSARVSTTRPLNSRKQFCWKNMNQWQWSILSEPWAQGHVFKIVTVYGLIHSDTEPTYGNHCLSWQQIDFSPTLFGIRTCLNTWLASSFKHIYCVLTEMRKKVGLLFSSL